MAATIHVHVLSRYLNLYLFFNLYQSNVLSASVQKWSGAFGSVVCWMSSRNDNTLNDCIFSMLGCFFKWCCYAPLPAAANCSLPHGHFLTQEDSQLTCALSASICIAEAGLSHHHSLNIDVTEAGHYLCLAMIAVENGVLGTWSWCAQDCAQRLSCSSASTD